MSTSPRIRPSGRIGVRYARPDLCPGERRPGRPLEIIHLALGTRGRRPTPQADYADAYLNLATARMTGARPKRGRFLDGPRRSIPRIPRWPTISESFSTLRETETGHCPHSGGRPRTIRATRGRENEEAIAAMVQAARLGSKDAQDALRSRGLAW